jgi:hypothetical protein
MTSIFSHLAFHERHYSSCSQLSSFPPRRMLWSWNTRQKADTMNKFIKQNNCRLTSIHYTLESFKIRESHTFLLWR